MLSLMYGYFLLNTFKVFGEKYLLDNKYLTFVGSVGALANSFFRIIWAWLVDHYSYKYIYSSILILQFCSASLIYWTESSHI